MKQDMMSFDCNSIASYIEDFILPHVLKATHSHIHTLCECHVPESLLEHDVTAVGLVYQISYMLVKHHTVSFMGYP